MNSLHVLSEQERFPYGTCLPKFVQLACKPSNPPSGPRKLTECIYCFLNIKGLFPYNILLSDKIELVYICKDWIDRCIQNNGSTIEVPSDTIRGVRGLEGVSIYVSTDRLIWRLVPDKKHGSLRYANQKTYFKYHRLRRLAIFDVTIFPAIFSVM